MSIAPETQVIDVLPRAGELAPARRRLFEAAIQLFGDRGYGSVSVRDLALEVGLTSTALYAHASSKEQLLFEIVRLGHLAQQDAITDALLSAVPDPVEQVRALTRAHVRFHLEWPALARVINRELRQLSDEHLEEIRRLRRDMQRPFLDVIERGGRLGVLDASTPRLTAQAIAALGVRTAEWINLDGLPGPDEIADRYADFAVRMVLAAGATA